MGPVKPNLVKTYCLYNQWTRSKAFSASIESSTESAVAVLTSWIRFRTRLVPSLACLPWINPTWSGEIKSGKILFTRLAIYLEKKIISQFSSEMGRKLVGLSNGFPGLGMVVMIEWSISAGWALFLIIALHNSRKWGARVSEKVW